MRSLILLFSSHWKLRCQQALLIGSAITLAACGGGPPPKLYLLEPFEADARQVELVSVSGIKSLGMSPVKLPGYSSDSKIATLRIDGTVFQDDNNRWAEPPEDAITRLLAERLRAHTEANVLIEPWPRDYEPVARVEVSFDKLLRQMDGGAQMTGQIVLLSSSGRELLKSVPFNISHVASDANNRVFFMAVARGIDDIARLAVQEIQALNRPS